MQGTLDYPSQLVLVDDFVGAALDPRWGKEETGAGGSISLVTPSKTGEVALAFDNTSEVARQGLNFSDKLCLDVTAIKWIEFLAKVSAGLTANIDAVLGLAAARNDDFDLITSSLWFRLNGGNTISVETDDGTTDKSESTSFSLAATRKRLRIWLADGLDQIKFEADDGDGALRQILPNTTFDASQLSGGVQPIAEVQKASSTDTATLTIDRIAIAYKDPQIR